MCPYFGNDAEIEVLASDFTVDGSPLARGVGAPERHVFGEVFFEDGVHVGAGVGAKRSGDGLHFGLSFRLCGLFQGRFPLPSDFII